MASFTGNSIASSYTSLLKLNGNTDSTVAGNNSNAVQVKTGDNDATPLYLNTDRLGIGGQPKAKLDISGDTGTWAGMAKVFLTDVNSNSDSRNWSIGNGGTAYGDLSFIVSNAADGVPADSTGTAVMVLDGVNQNVGIGKSSAGQKLEIKGDHSGDGINTFYHNNTNPAWEIVAYGTDGGYIFGKNNSATVNVQIRTDGDSYFKGGKLGIGTSSINANSTLHIAASEPNIFLEDTDDNQDWRIYGGSVFMIQDVTNSDATRLRIDSNSRISLSNNDSGTGNTVFGNIAGDDLTNNSEYNVLIGHNSGHAITTGDYNVAIGVNSIDSATNPQRVVALGAAACRGNLTSDAQGTVAVGYAAANALTAGQYNTAIGYESMDSLTVGDRNTAVGYQTLSALTGVDGEQSNTAVGYVSGLSITSGVKNTSMGAESLDGLTTGDSNVAIGHIALGSETIGNQTTAIGAESLYSQNMDADENSKNVGVGTMAGYRNVTGTDNTLIGHSAGLGASGQSHSANTAVGSSALYNITTGTDNVAVGIKALEAVTDSQYNVGVGRQAAFKITTGDKNIALGAGTLALATTASSIVAIGHDAAYSVSSSSVVSDGMVAIGDSAANAITTGERNLAVGYQALVAADVCDDSIAIGYQAMSGTDAGACNKNIAIGSYALDGALSNSVNNIAIGVSALGASTSGSSNVVIGGNVAGANITTASNIVAIGDGALGGAAQSNGNTGVGYATLYNATGAKNTALGYQSANTVTGGTENTVIGWDADTTGSGAVNQTVIGSETLGVSDNSVTLGNSAVTDVYMAYDKAATVHAGGLLIGASSQVSSSQFTIEAVDYPFMTLRNTATPDGSKIGGRLDFNFANGTSKPTVANDIVGQIVWLGQGNDADYASAAMINTITTGGNITRANQVSKLEFQTKNSGANGCATRLTIAGDGTFTGSSSNDISDERLKENIKSIDNGLDTINKLQGRTFSWKEEADMSKGTKYGLIAQELEKVLPDLVYNESGIRQKEDGEYYKSITMNGIIPVLIEAVKELSTKVTELENKLK